MFLVILHENFILHIHENELSFRFIMFIEMKYKLYA